MLSNINKEKSIYLLLGKYFHISINWNFEFKISMNRGSFTNYVAPEGEEGLNVING
jgi:hypothetical protein